MPARPSSDPKQFIQGAAVLHVPDVLATAAFYRDVLGFTWDFGDETYAVVWRDNSAIHFVKEAEGPRGVHLFQWVNDVDGYYRRLSIGAPRFQRSPQISRTEFASSACATSMAWASCSGKTSNRVNVASDLNRVPLRGWHELRARRRGAAVHGTVQRMIPMKNRTSSKIRMRTIITSSASPRAMPVCSTAKR
jgi:hypothetical protein